MGAYLSEPRTEKFSSDDDSDRVRYGASSMQGWRVSQEDAHNCVIHFDKNTSLFAVYDGHGGPEVALYCSQKLPDFIKQTEAYKRGDLKNALIDAFLGFDATIATKEVIEVLKELAGVKDQNDSGQVDTGSDEEDENVRNLYEEASMPIEQVMEKYQSNMLCPSFKKISGEMFPISPMLKARKDTEDKPGCSGQSFKSDTSVVNSSEATDTNNEPTSSSASTDTSSNTCTSSTEPTINTATSTSNDSNSQEDSQNSSSKSDETNSSNDTQPCIEEIKKPVANGEVSEEEKSVSKSPQENGEVSPSSKGKGKAIAKKKEVAVGTVKNLRSRSARPLFTELLDFKDDSDSEDENDTTFEGTVSNSSSDEGGDDDDDESSDDVDEEEDDDEEEDEDEGDVDMYEDNEFTRNMREEPGSDSGCTAVVALLRGNELLVANAGDSRCVVCRGGRAVDMSFDHKPEDEPEMERVLRAGGKVTQDGRVNGGLNLSRAIGDHAYKQNKELPATEQMITALPDVRTLTVNPAEDEFMVLACDGIWNFMSSQDVVDFVRTRLQETPAQPLSAICEQMFDHCLAPHTMGDGTGCDNMTAVIVQFKSTGLKRAASPTPDLDTKRAKTDDPDNITDTSTTTTTTTTITTTTTSATTIPIDAAV